MLISYKYNFIFIHIFKTAGTSVSMRLAPHARLRDALIYGYRPTRKVMLGLNILTKRKLIKSLTGFTPHASALEIRQKLPDRLFNASYKFAFVRNPWDWLASLYFFLRQNTRDPQHLKVMSLEFNDFVKWKVDAKIKRQVDFVSDGSGNLIVDFIGKYENLNEDYERIIRRIGLNTATLPRANVSNNRKSRSYRQLYDADTRDLVQSYFRKDIEVFGYSFE